MGQRGTRAQPTAMKVMKGGRADRINTNEPPKVGELRDEPPEWLDPTAKEVWSRYAPILREMGVTGGQDALAFEALCQTYAVWRFKPGNMSAVNSLRAQLASFGLDPSSRSGMKLPQGAGVDPLDAKLRAQGL